MNRAEALALAQSIGLNSVMIQAGRLTTDTPQGYGPALDRAFSAYIKVNSLATTPTTTTVLPADEFGFSWLVQGTTYDIVLPMLAIVPDLSVDAPLTNVKFTQIFNNLMKLRDKAWQEAGYFGYTEAANVGGHKMHLDFNEPPDTRDFQ